MKDDNKEQLAVAWLISELTKKERNTINGSYLTVDNTIKGREIQNLFNKALEMGKSQIIKSNLDGFETAIKSINEFFPVDKTIKLVEDIKLGKETNEDGEEYFNNNFK